MSPFSEFLIPIPMVSLVRPRQPQMAFKYQYGVSGIRTSSPAILCRLHTFQPSSFGELSGGNDFIQAFDKLIEYFRRNAADLLTQPFR